ncbi:MAG: hypothetical protein K0R03_311 [Moraxellaceae bacterium]|jgi:uncharacterized repeat protein (TIGR01451 family)|nr:hypothetical protein [Moraxellaceae bacterium]
MRISLRVRAAILATAAATFLTPLAYALGTAAGIDITNVATATYTDPFEGPKTVDSNTSVLQVDEILDVTITANDSGNVNTMSPDSNRVLSFTVSNTGNGSETYALSTVSNLGGDAFDPTSVRIYLDNGDNVFNILTDTLLVPGTNDPVLAANGTRRIYVVSDIPGSLTNSNVGLVRLVAEAVTAQATAGADAPGTTFAGAGDNGSDAVVGNTQADATGQNGYVVSLLATTFTKSSSVLDPFGNSTAVPGAVITYTLTFNVTGVGTLTGAQIVDPIPADTTYVPGSLTLQIDAGAATPLTDAADGDAGRLNGNQIEVTLGTAGSVTAASTQTVTFQVEID